VLDTLSRVEFMSRDEGRSVGESASTKKWAKDVQALGPSWEDLTVFRARLMWYEDEMMLNLERLGIAQDGTTTWSDQNGPNSLKAAKKDFYAAFLRLRLYKSRADNLTSIVTDLVNLRGAVQSLEVGRLGLKLGVLSAIFFPITLVAAIFSMGENFKPGAKLFWIPWVVAVPLVFLMGAYLILPRVRGNYVSQGEAEGVAVIHGASQTRQLV
jgi:Mg2+ and Co2+ transporter CorA